ncbi:hypothetical protein ACTP13_07600 [Paenibacillus peoriae]|uniref:hypothetical protein n=1 Tax=Paenibacillus peoriae TaxID=59893 RepID=UPI003F999DE7
MKKIFFSQITYAYEFTSIEIFFKYKNMTFFSTDNLTNIYINNGASEAREFKLACITSIEEHEGPSEINRYNRASILTVLGVVSFFVGIPLTVYHKTEGRDTIIEGNSIYNKPLKLVIDNEDYTQQLKSVLEKLESDEEVVVSLLDRWRKANYLVNESVDANLYHDEAILSYFHIIELICEIYSKGLRVDLEENIRDYVEDFYKKNFFFNENQLESQVNSVKKVFTEVLIGRDLALSHKIKFVLNKFNMLNPFVEYFIDSVIKMRNAIAHGRFTYQEKLSWPLPPFFFMSNESFEILGSLNFLTARLISCYLGIECWKKEWEEVDKDLMPPDKLLKRFLTNATEFPELNCISINEPNQYHITWGTIFKHYVSNPKKFKIEKIDMSLKSLFINSSVNESTAGDLFNISVILSDSKDEEIQNTAI